MTNLIDRALQLYAHAPEHPAKQRLFNWLCRRLRAGRPLELTLADGLRLRLRPDEFLERRLIFIDSHEPLTTRFLLANLASGQTAFIAGAHIGYHVLQAARAVGPDGRVIACEPVPASLAATLDHLQLNGLADRATCLCAALGEHVGHVPLALPDHDLHMVGLASPPARAVYHAQVLSIAAVLETLGAPCPDLLLLDVEGYEWTALRGLGVHRPSLLVLESDPRSHAQMGESQADFFAFLRTMGYSLHAVFGAPVSTTGFFTENNIVAVRADRPPPHWPTLAVTGQRAGAQ